MLSSMSQRLGFDIDDDDIRVDLLDAPRQAIHVVDDGHPLI